MEKLPEKWCIISKNKGQDPVINAYARSLAWGEHWGDNSNFAKNYYLHVNSGEYVAGCPTPRSEYIEICFEDFERLVLGKTSSSINNILIFN